MTTIVLATRNRHKAGEFAELFDGIPVQFRTLDEFPGAPVTVEDAGTLEGNALKKARECFRATGLASLADDTGLEVYYLNSEPGVLSSRYAGAGASYADNCSKLLRKLRGVPSRRRGARFRCVLAFVRSDGTEVFAEGIVRGSIAESARGEGGFGYDPLFVPEGYDRSFAQMAPAEKNNISHRGRAAAALAEILPSHFA